MVDDCEKSRTEDPDELLDGDDLDVDASDVEVSFPEDGLEPAAWMAYNNMGGAGLVPYLLKSRAERNTASEVEEVAEEFPKPLYYATGSDHHPPADGWIAVVRDIANGLDADRKSGSFNCDDCIQEGRLCNYHRGFQDAVNCLHRKLDEELEFTQDGNGE